MITKSEPSVKELVKVRTDAVIEVLGQIRARMMFSDDHMVTRESMIRLLDEWIAAQTSTSEWAADHS